MTEENKPKPYVTERTKMWRAVGLEPTFSSTLDNIEEYGWEVMSVTEDGAGQRFAYTIGVFDTLGLPEIITVGLKSETATCALNESVERMRSGANLTNGRHREIVGEVECEFIPVDPKWAHHVMGRADWYYEQIDVPVLQLIYPDLENRFQGDEGFQEYFRQPVLKPGAEKTRLEDDFWASNDPDSSLFNWKFPDSPHTRVFLSQTVQDKKEEVTYVSHDSDDGSWQFLGDSMSEGGGPVISCFHHPIDDDPTLDELHDLPLGWYAVRDKPGAPWERYRHEDESDEVAEEVTD